MEYRFTQILVVLLWVVSMGWLVSTKLLPSAFSRDAPNYRVVGPETEGVPRRVRWQIEYQTQVIGTATTTIHRPQQGTPVVRSEVVLEEVPLGEMLERVIGIWPLISRAAGIFDRNLRVSMTIATRIHLDGFGNLMFFQSDVGVDNVPDILRARGRVLDENRLEVIVSAGTGLPTSAWGGKIELMKYNLQVSPEALVVDGLAPHPRLANLKVGQEWTMESVRAFASHSPLQTIRARVERTQLMPWGREMENMFVVVMEDVVPHGLTTAQGSKVRLWVCSDGTVVRQRLEWAGLVIEFVRLPSETLRSVTR